MSLDNLISTLGSDINVDEFDNILSEIGLLVLEDFYFFYNAKNLNISRFSDFLSIFKTTSNPHPNKTLKHK